MGERRGASAAIAALLIVALAACTPEAAPAPPPSPSVVSSEDAAFAAAEATYRAYVDALNAVDLADPSTFEPVFATTIGEARSTAVTQFTSMHDKGWTVTGRTHAVKIEPMMKPSPAIIRLAVCVDVSTVKLVDKSGASVVNPGREDIQAMRIDLQRDADGVWLISEFAARDGKPICDVG